MGFLSKFFGKKKKVSTQEHVPVIVGIEEWTPPEDNLRLRNESQAYFEVARPSGDGRCSDNKCPCPEMKIPRGSGYLYISQEVVDFRRDAPKINDLKRMYGNTLLGGVGAPVLMCEQGAKLRELDLAVAATDAKYWWESGLAPLRATPVIRNIK